MDVLKHVCEFHELEKKNCCQWPKDLRLAGRYGYTPGGVEWSGCDVAGGKFDLLLPHPEFPPHAIYAHCFSYKAELCVKYWEVLLWTTMLRNFKPTSVISGCSCARRVSTTCFPLCCSLRRVLLADVYHRHANKQQSPSRRNGRATCCLSLIRKLPNSSSSSSIILDGKQI
ncbi:hypothetical protein T4E_11764 [Trichinella pseudospiralis]|uniref:Uncharacterized protein n=1 Tax=Trichinella pseudospiralis TaxID=6337 RepID=A0A0V0XR41_TRIPS|nr:hypothetical protein T4E_11764 [Trichinella pseudospiralis]